MAIIPLLGSEHCTHLDPVLAGYLDDIEATSVNMLQAGGDDMDLARKLGIQSRDIRTHLEGKKILFSVQQHVLRKLRSAFSCIQPSDLTNPIRASICKRITAILRLPLDLPQQRLTA